MSQYYSADVLREHAKELAKEPTSSHEGESYFDGIQTIITEIKYFPKESTVELTLCRDCKYRHSPDGNNIYCCKHESGLSGVVKDDYFCSFGSKY